MKQICIMILIPSLLAFGACRKAPPAPEPPPTPRPAGTPHPARGTTEAAIRLYPDLAKQDSTFNRTFRDLYTERAKTRPESLARVDWPLNLAHETASMLGVQPASPTTPAPATPVARAPATPTPAPRVNALERGAYDEKRGVARPPEFR